MERPSTRTPRRTAPPPRPPAGHQAGVAVGGAGAESGENATVYQARTAGPLPESLLAAVRRLPEPKLTGFGTGMLATLAMLAVGCLDALLLSGSPTAYGLLFLLVCAASGVWVRPADLIAGPVSVPIAFTVGLVPLGEDGNGLGGQAMNVVTSLSLEVGWLYTGTLIAGLIVLVRRIALVGRRQRRGRQRSGAPRAGRERPGALGQRARRGPGPGQPAASADDVAYAAEAAGQRRVERAGRGRSAEAEGVRSRRPSPDRAPRQPGRNPAGEGQRVDWRAPRP
ncbi:DUF6542 domain-containing protein [Streptomyces sp. NPDC057702]|uniref:DUF6542 domain-containing protein n=1 Tax=unclassified Streptomyces TaxID=2593676 RepID=UPI0036C22F33